MSSPARRYHFLFTTLLCASVLASIPTGRLYAADAGRTQAIVNAADAFLNTLDAAAKSKVTKPKSTKPKATKAAAKPKRYAAKKGTD